MGKKNEKENKKKIKRVIAKEERSRGKKKEKKVQKKAVKSKKKQNKDDESQNEEEEFEDFILPGQKNSTPPAGDATRAFYESLLEQRPDSIMAKKYCVEYGCLDADKANEFIKDLEKKKKKK